MASEAKRRGISIFAIGVTMQVIEVSYIIIPYLNVDILYYANQGRRYRGHMIVGFATICVIIAYHR
jgi:hypothetical protein